MQAYYVIDDCLEHSSIEGFVVMFGDPVEARGFEEGQFLTLREAKAFVSKHLAPNEIAYRVRLARRHGSHSVEPLFPIVFSEGMDVRCRQVFKPTAAKFKVRENDWRYCVIGTQYGHVHTSGGNARTWRSLDAAQRFARNCK